MSQRTDSPATHIATYTVEDIFVRDRSLCNELMGHLTFTEMIVFHLLGRQPSPAQTAIVDACLVTLMEHGLTPSAISARLTYSAAPEALQGAVAAGLLGVGSVFVGAMEACGRLLEPLTADGVDVTGEALRIAGEHRSAGRRLPGFGHHLHKPDNPRATRLFELAEQHGTSGPHVAAIQALSRAVDEVFGKHVTINATGAVAAVLGDVGVPRDILRGFALISRCAGLVGHIHEEQRTPATATIWQAAERAVPYQSGDQNGND